MDVPKEENVEYHIEIQKCEEGAENNDGEVMYVLDFGGADIPENLAMSIAQWAADRSLPLEDGNNSFVFQNDAGVGMEQAPQVMQVEAGNGIVDVGNNGGVEGDVPQVIHVKMEDGSDYIMDGTAVDGGVSGDSIVYSVQEDGSIIHVEKPGGIGGRIEQRKTMTTNTNASDNSLLNLEQCGNIQIQNPDGTHTTLITRKPFVVRNENNNKMLERKLGGRSQSTTSQTLAKNSSSSSSNSVHNNKAGDRLPITPFLKGKTPVMLMVGEDGQVTTDVASLPPIKIESTKKPETTEKADDNEGSDLQHTQVVSEPMILDFPTEKSKLDNQMVVVNTKNSESNSNDAIPDGGLTVTSLESSEGIESKSEETEKEQASLDKGVESEVDDKDDSVNAQIKDELMTAGEETQNEEDDSVYIKRGAMLVMDTEKIVKICTYENCEFQTSDQTMYAAHMDTEHEDLTPYCCFICDKRFKLDLTLKIHQIIHMKNARPARKKRGPYGARDKFYICSLCSHQDKYKRDALMHAKDEHDIEKPYTCESCKFICFTQMELDHHNETVTHRTDNKNYCDICNQLFTNIYQHRAAVHTKDRPHCCTECDYRAKTKSSLRYHMVTHLSTKDWQCTSCPYKTTTERRLKRHMKIHDPNKKYICNLCSFATHDSYEYKRHHIKVHSKTKTYTCKFCEQKFSKHHEIRLHLMFEHDCNDAFFCNHCDFTCSTRATYKEHIQTHYGKHRHVCEICGFTGRYKTHYRRHMLTHSDERPFECNICGKKVSESSNLRRHMLTHTEDKPLACSVCGYRCKIRSRLMNHMKTHSELRPFACHLCKYTTKFNGNLMKHLENHAKYKPHKCQHCSYSCNEKNKLKRHVAFRHKSLIEPKQEVMEVDNNEESQVTSSTGGEVTAKEIINALPSKDQILLLPNKELVIMQGDNEERIVLPVDENGIVMASADQEDLMAQLESGSVVLTVEDAPASEPHVSGEQQIIHQESSIAVANGVEDASSVVILQTEG